MTDRPFTMALAQNPAGNPQVSLDETHSPLKVLAHPGLLKDFIAGRQLRPIHMRIGITGACNMRCNFCNFHSENEAQFYDHFSFKDTIPTPDAIALLREFAETGGRAVTFCGSGECTIHPGYVEICTAAFEAGLRIGVVTNGSMLHRDAMAQCIKETHTWVRIGMNAGDSRTFAQITHQKSEVFSRLLAAIGPLRSQAIAEDFRVGLNYVITRENFQEIVQAARIARDSGSCYIRYEPEFYSAMGHETIVRHMEEISAALAKAAELESDTFEVSIPKLDRGPMDKTQTVEGDFKRCHYSRFVTAVGADHHLYPCPQVHLNDRYRMGNVVRDGYQAVLEGGPREDWDRKNPLRTDLCKSCFYRPQNELLEWILEGKIDLDRSLEDYVAENPDTLHADFI